MWDFDWEGELSRLKSTVRVARHKLNKLSISEQVAVFLNAGGLFGNGGAQFVWLLWMKPNSAALIIWYPNAKVTSCADLPATFHEGTAWNTGHTFVSWRSCENTNNFAQEKPAQVLNFLANFRNEAAARGQARGCFILQKRREHAPWPRCDIDIAGPLLDTRLHSWPPYSKVGQNLGESAEERLG